MCVHVWSAGMTSVVYDSVNPVWPATETICVNLERLVEHQLCFEIRDDWPRELTVNASLPQRDTLFRMQDGIKSVQGFFLMICQLRRWLNAKSLILSIAVPPVSLLTTCAFSICYAHIRLFRRSG